MTYRKANRVHNSWDIPITIQWTPDIWRCQYNTLLSSRTALKYIIKSEHWNQYSNLTNYTPCFALMGEQRGVYLRDNYREISGARCTHLVTSFLQHLLRKTEARITPLSNGLQKAELHNLISRDPSRLHRLHPPKTMGCNYLSMI